MQPNWREIEYLKVGSTQQQRAYAAVSRAGILETLRAFDPALVSTICIDLAVDDSDLDIICEIKEPGALSNLLKTQYGSFPGFSVRLGPPLVARWQLEGFWFEVFADSRPIETQNAWRHLSLVARMLRIGGKKFYAQIRSLRGEGLKMEESVCRILNLEGNPFEALLGLEQQSDEELLLLIAPSSKNV